MSAEALSLAIRMQRVGFELQVAEELQLGGVTALFGPSGGGKSTLLRAIAGFERPDGGHVRFGNELWFDSERRLDVAPHRRPVGFMFQEAALFPHLDVAGNLRFAERRRTAPGGAGFGAVVRALDLQPLLSRPVTALSGGERQRAALGRTLLSGPRLLLLDEPLAALDRSRKSEILPYLEGLHGEFGVPTIYVSHDIDEVACLAETAIVLARGRVQAVGRMADIAERLDLQPYTGRYEAGVVVEGRLLRHDRRLRLTHIDLHGEHLALPMVERLADGAPIRLRIRARDVAVATERPRNTSIRNVLHGTLVDIVEEPGTGFADLLIQLRTDRIKARITLASVEELALERGASVFALIRSVSFE